MEPTGPNRAPEAEKSELDEAESPVGHFLSRELASDTARFLTELRIRLRRRAETPSSLELGDPDS